MTDRPIYIFTDGACSGNPGPGGYGAVIVDSNNCVIELGDSEENTTNNRMELRACIHGVQQLLENYHSSPVWILTDSTYVIQGITQWIFGWRKRGWLTAAGEVVSNKNLWQELDQAVENWGRGLFQWKYVRGHAGVVGNERCDSIAVEFSQGQEPALFNGTLKDYPFDILNIPTDLSLPSPSNHSSSQKSKAYSYLSLVEGVVKRHSTWSECEARVKGVSGAKFKKATSQVNESEILRNWGVSGFDRG